MNDRERLEAIVKVVRQYLPPDGIYGKEAMGKIIELVDPLPPKREWVTDLRKAAEMALEALERLDRWLALRYGQELTPPEKDVVEALRQALAHEALDRMVAENQKLGLYDDAAPEVTPEVTTEVPCKTHPDAPHGFDRNASHSADRYVCECEGWEPVDNAYTKNDTKAGVLHKEWVGLTKTERFEIEVAMSKYYDYQHECKTVCLPEFAAAIEAKLKEKNT